MMSGEQRLKFQTRESQGMRNTKPQSILTAAWIDHGKGMDVRSGGVSLHHLPRVSAVEQFLEIAAPSFGYRIIDLTSDRVL